MLLAAAAAPFIEKELGKFLKLEPGKTDTSGGKIRLKKVAIREDAFDELALPIALRGGFIEEVEVRGATCLTRPVGAVPAWWRCHTESYTPPSPRRSTSRG
jgi:hypothetical protein